jgi:hypothetical protein
MSVQAYGARSSEWVAPTSLCVMLLLKYFKFESLGRYPKSLNTFPDYHMLNVDGGSGNKSGQQL